MIIDYKPPPPPPAYSAAPPRYQPPGQPLPPNERHLQVHQPAQPHSRVSRRAHPGFTQTSLNRAPLASRPSSRQARSSFSFSSLPQHIVLQICQETCPNYSVDPRGYRHAFYWIATSLRLVSRGFWIGERSSIYLFLLRLL